MGREFGTYGREERPLRRSRRRWKIILKLGRIEMGWEGMNWG